MLELVNRARQDPIAEVARNSSVDDLNDDLGAGTISAAAKQPLAPHQALVVAAQLHAQDMLDNDFFSHTNLAGQSPTSRAADQQYPETVAENIAWYGSTGTIDQTDAVHTAHRNLFASPGHRVNLMTPSDNEVGIGVRFGAFTDPEDSTTYNAVMAAQSFAERDVTPYITGVVYDDSTLNDDFYSVGEGHADVRVSALNVATGRSYWTNTVSTGGYAVSVPAGAYTVVASGSTLTSPLVTVNVVVGAENVKVDFDVSETQGVTTDDLVGIAANTVWVGQAVAGELSNSFFGTLGSPDFSSTGDFNGDGLEDIVLRQPDGQWLVGLSTSTNFVVQPWGSFSAVVTWAELHVGDFNGDGLADVLGRADSDGTLWVGESQGNGLINQFWGTLSTGTSWTDFRVGDFNGDGMDDLAARASSGSWWVAKSNGSDFTITPWASWSTTVAWLDVSVGDFDGDGRDDIVGRANNQDWWINRSTTGDFFIVEYWGTWSDVAWLDVRSADPDGDGDDDLLGRFNGQWWIANSNTEKFANQAWGYWTTAVAWSDVLVADIDGDDNDEILGRSNAGEWWQTGTLGIAAETTFLGRWSTTAWSSVSAGNFA